MLIGGVTTRLSLLDKFGIVRGTCSEDTPGPFNSALSHWFPGKKAPRRHCSSQGKLDMGNCFSLLPIPRSPKLAFQVQGAA